MRFPRLLKLTLSLVSAGSLLIGCGAVPVGAAGAVKLADGQAMAQLGFGAEGGEDPAVIQRRDGATVVAYVGTHVADRQLYVAVAETDLAFGAARPVGEGDYSDQEPCLVEDEAGVLHLFFASNRDGENFELYHSRMDGEAFSAPERIAGFTGLQGLAVTQHGGRFLLAAELMGQGLFVGTSADGTNWTARERVANAGFEPAATFLSDGTALVVYQRSGQLFFRASRPGGDWSPEASAAKGADRLRTPALAWTGEAGALVYCERTPKGYQLRNKRFDAELRFSAGAPLPALGGEPRKPAISARQNAEISLAWGMKLSSGQEGIALTVLRD